MPLKILHPKNNAKTKRKLLIVQGKCDNAANVTGVLVNKANGQQIAGQKLTSKPKQWGYLYKGLTKSTYKFSVTEASSLAASATIDFEVDPTPPPPPPTPQPPTIVSPADGEEVAVVYYPYGASADTITELVFFDATNSQNGTILQQPDVDGNWYGQVDGIDTWPNGSGNPYQLRSTNSAGSTTVNNLTIATP